MPPAGNQSPITAKQGNSLFYYLYTIGGFVVIFLGVIAYGYSKHWPTLLFWSYVFAASIFISGALLQLLWRQSIGRPRHILAVIQILWSLLIVIACALAYFVLFQNPNVSLNLLRLPQKQSSYTQ
jgi:peptidoglycan/LPS O-acetylase OafA/YrhL